MATYAAVVSVFHVMDNIKTYRVRDPRFLNEQKTQLQSLGEYVIVLQQFLENWSSRGYSNEGLESRIADAAYKAEDIIEIYIMDYLEAEHVEENSKGKDDPVFTCHVRMRSDHFSVELQRVLDHMESLLMEVVEIKDSDNSQVQQPRHFEPATSVTPVPPTRNSSMKLFCNETNQVMDKLTDAGHNNLLTCCLIGMGGTGKTTLAKIIFENLVIVNHFDMRGWVTVSQEFNPRELLVVLLRKTNAHFDESLDYQQLGEVLHKHLFGRRYLIVMDDVWDIEALGKLKVFFPNNDNGSRVLVTTRMSDVAVHSDFNHTMTFLNEKQSWELLTELEFGNGSCPSELEAILKMIARNCRGLLLSLSVIGGLIANSDMKQEYLEYIAKDTTAIVNSNDEDHCLEILSTSYNHLPVHLKPCFLYFGSFEEDENISVAKLIKLWVSEGILKPNETKSLEEAAEDYLTDLICRNLIFVSHFGYAGSVEHCKIHDILRDFCLREARKDRFLCVYKFRNLVTSQGFNSYRRVAIHGRNRGGEGFFTLHSALQSSVYPRSLTFYSRYLAPPFDVKLLRVLSGRDIDYIWEKSFEINLRCIFADNSYLPRSIPLLWNLQTLYISKSEIINAEFDIWEMPLLRHVSIDNGFFLTDPRVGKTEVQDNIVLKNLQTLETIHDITFTEKVLRKIPNIKKLRVRYYEIDLLSSDIYLKNLGSLHKLELLSCHFDFYNQGDMMGQSRLFRTLEFPLSLKELHLIGCVFDWEDVGRKIGSLPHLEMLTLCCELSGKEEWNTIEKQFLSLRFPVFCFSDFVPRTSVHFPCHLQLRGEEEWNTIEGQFQSLKVLRLSNSDLVRWTTDSTHFPCLEHLQLRNLEQLEEIPSEIGDIQTRRSIRVIDCADSVRDSATRILQEQRSYGNEDFNILLSPYQILDQSLR